MTLSDTAMGQPQATRTLTVLDKGLPLSTPVLEIGQRGWNVLAGHLPFPAAVLKKSAIAHNSRWMQGFLAATGASLAPHGKTTMSPRLFQQQIADGCWGITVATAQQAAVAAMHGIKRILIANQLVGPANIAIALDLLKRDPALELYCYVDSVAAVAMLDEAVRQAKSRPVNVLLEVGFKGGRTGCRTRGAIEQVLLALSRAEVSLKLRGIAGYEGLITADSSAATEKAVTSFLDLMIETVGYCRQQNAFKPTTDGKAEIIVSAGGSTFFDMVAQRLATLKAAADIRIVIRSGCYLTHDHGIYAHDFPGLQRRIGTELARQLGQLQPALYVWTMVQSQPEPGLALLTLGKRDAGHDSGWPRPVMHRSAKGGGIVNLDDSWQIEKMNDQHAYLKMPADHAPAIGDLIAVGISHPCTTFDKWREIFLVDDDWTVVDSLHTYF